MSCLFSSIGKKSAVSQIHIHKDPNQKGVMSRVLRVWICLYLQQNNNSTETSIDILRLKIDKSASGWKTMGFSEKCSLRFWTFWCLGTKSVEVNRSQSSLFLVSVLLLAVQCVFHASILKHLGNASHLVSFWYKQGADRGMQPSTPISHVEEESYREVNWPAKCHAESEWESQKQNSGLWTPAALSARQCCLL